MKISKTSFLIYRDCAHNAWMKLHRPEVYNAEPLSEFDRTILDAGNEVDVLARDVFPGGVLVERGAAERTAALVAARAPVLYQPVFETERFTCACDVLVWNPASGAYDLFEVKASTNGGNTKAKDELYTYDIGFQAEVLRQNGVPLGRLNLVRLATTYTRGETLDIGQLLTREDYTDRVDAIRDSLALEMDAAHDVLQNAEPLAPPCACMLKGRSNQCTTFAATNPGVPAYSVHDITRIGAARTRLADLVNAGILAIEDVPDDFPLSEAQANQVRAAKTGRISIDRAAIGDFLAAMRFPIAFLDYETFPAAVPRFPGYRPFDQIPFQFSLDVLPSPDADLVHYEHLHLTPDAPDPGLLAALRSALPDRGSIVVWNETFEQGINDRLGDRNPAFRDWLSDVNVRVVDLMDVFSMQAYVHPAFKGRTSIKSVLPVLVPGFSYDRLSIREGATATARWNDVVSGKIGGVAAEAIRTDLLAYCGLDSRAMAEIWRVLVRETEPAREAI